MKRLLIFFFSIVPVLVFAQEYSFKNKVSLGFGAVVDSRDIRFSPCVDVLYGRNLYKGLNFNTLIKYKRLNYNLMEHPELSNDDYNSCDMHALCIGVEYRIPICKSLYLSPGINIGLGMNYGHYISMVWTKEHILEIGALINPKVNLEYQIKDHWLVSLSCNYDLNLFNSEIDNYHHSESFVKNLKQKKIMYKPYYNCDLKIGIGYLF